MPENSIMSISMRWVDRLSSSDSTKQLGLVVQEERAIEQVHAHHAQRLLLQLRFPVQHAHVQHDLALLRREDDSGT